MTSISRLFLLILPWFISFHEAHSQEIPIAIVNGIIIDGLGGEPLRGYDILLQEGKIIKLGKHLLVPKGAKIIDATGKSVIPGLIDMHGHLYALGTTQLAAYPYLYLAGGVTTIFSPGEFEPEKTFALKESIRIGTAVGPDILFATYFDTKQSNDNWMHPVSDSIQLAQRFDAWKNRIDGIKVYNHISEKHFDMLVIRARQNNLIVTGHLGSLSTKYAIDHGINGLEHGLFAIKDFGGDPNDFWNFLCGISTLDLTTHSVEELVELIVSKKVYVDPTIVAFESLLSNFDPVVGDYRSYLTEKAREYFDKVDASVSSMVNQVCLQKALAKQLQFSKLIFDNKGLLVTGTDPVSPKVLPGFGIRREIRLLVKAGIPIVEAIKIASYNGATALKISQMTGIIKVRMNADLVIIDGDITQNIDNLDKIKFVLKKGVMYDPNELLKKAKGKVDSGDWIPKE